MGTRTLWRGEGEGWDGCGRGKDLETFRGADWS